MKIALCNEVLRELPFAAQCGYAAALGYDGIELAPFTLGEEPHLLAAPARAQIRRAAADAGVEIMGLHWLLVTPEGLSITSRDASVRARTLDVMRRLVGLCSDLGGRVMVHGSPAQRLVGPDDDWGAAWARARDSFIAVAPDVEAAGLTYCIEPLARRETDFINTVAEAVKLVEAIGSPTFRAMIDTGAAALTEDLPVPDLLDRWLPAGAIGHVQLSDANRRGPGQGPDQFAPILSALARHGYAGVVSVEPFDYHPDGPATAARAIGYIRGILETLGWHA